MIQDTQEARTETFDALVVCNGHYSEPRVPAIPGSQEFPGRQLHTHNFRENSCFAGQTVVVMGASASGQDIAREIADVAKTVSAMGNPLSQPCTALPTDMRYKDWNLLDSPLRKAQTAKWIVEQGIRLRHPDAGSAHCAMRCEKIGVHKGFDLFNFQGTRSDSVGRATDKQPVFDSDRVSQVYFSARPVRFGSKQVDWEPSEEPFGPRGNLLRRAVIKSLGRDGSVTFADGTRAEKVDSVVFATGYKFSFPFLDEAGVITVQDNRSATAATNAAAVNP